MSAHVTYVYEKVSTKRTKYGRCPICGRKVNRSKTFWQTFNPFNRNPDGSQRTRDEIRADLNAQADWWVPDFTHEGCR